MGLQLSILVGCVGAVELLACLKHVAVCVLKLTDEPSSHCCIDYFHRPGLHEDFVIIDKSGLEESDAGNEERTCSKIEAILRETRSEPDVLCLGPPAVVDGYVRVATPIPFGVDDVAVDQKSSSNESSLIDSGNENPVRSTTTATTSHKNGSASDVSSLEETENSDRPVKSKKHVRRSKTPEFFAGSCDDYNDNDEEDSSNHHKKPHHKISKSSAVVRKSTKTKSKTSELRKSADNLSTTRRSKRHREPERCKSDIQIQSVRNPLRDEWTNTDDGSFGLGKVSHNKHPSVSVLIQTSFEDKLQLSENKDFQSRTDVSNKLNVCPNCSCRQLDDQDSSARVKRITESVGGSVDGKPQLIKISSFEEASEDDYEKFKSCVLGSGRSKVGGGDSWVKSSLESESHDEYIDAEEGLTFSDQPIEYAIPDTGDNQFSWVMIAKTPPHEDVTLST